MHEIERHRVILREIAEQPVVTVAQLVGLTGASAATIRRDINALHHQSRLRRVRGGAEASAPPQAVGIVGRSFAANQGINVEKKRAIAKAAVDLCNDGDSIIINGDTTTLQMVYHLVDRRLQILTNSFPIADHLLRYSRNDIVLPGGTVYREQNIILSPFENDVTRNFFAHRMFTSAEGLGAAGVMESDPLLIQAEQKLIDQSEELILLVDSAKFSARSSLILCPLERVHTVITDDSVATSDAKLIERSGIQLIIADHGNSHAAAATA